MTPPTYSLKSLLLALSLLGTSTLAQNATNTTGPSCRVYSDNDHPVNSSGTVNISDIYVSVTFGESKGSTEKGMPWLYTYISAPESSTKQIRATMFNSIFDKKQGDSANGCGGVLSQNCIDGLKRQLALPMNTNNNGEVECPGFMTSDSAIKSACGETPVITKSTVVSTVTGVNATNTTCVSTSPPQYLNWNLPSDYRTHDLFGISPEAGKSDHYDEYVMSPVPVVISSYDGEVVDTQVVCVAPRDVRQGSRVPSAGVGVDWRSTRGMAVVVAGLVEVSVMLF
ncbi:hypothetical protein PtrSN002B_003451 [Pyrenophora tritici-repentis]|uniref:Uncharacterized protein n=1 Tax=Pyrenophora tritici-repentis TaxID=45151 RepID=A0A2W1H7S0_9PLEO|nr:hypothetical protein Ptr86124_012006 [Pyrenophora tritici-repentis]KAI1546309.1 hypothetical protein PtrSN001C_002912 [Pyrenophora tritici-repentis]KAI1555012.1 hypothetical protein PtrSN002B_003451 [Pyrenophora tritici-repentis]KAI1574425.1 hypothetical protein PtrEW4_003217 [Pyrenophora tritici-repentis]KAI1592532.1 hypothetical protein PtrEW13061_003718 [Pyrenophora tritici-repentis]